LIEAFLTSDNQAMRDAFIMGLARSRAELSPDDYAAALHRIRDQLNGPPPG
jgi:hypothetical protein